jgi:hypothetical protein
LNDTLLLDKKAAENVCMLRLRVSDLLSAIIEQEAQIREVALGDTLTPYPESVM